MVLLCVEKWILGISENSRKIQENPRTRSFHEPEVGPEGSHRGSKRPAGAAPPLAAPTGRLEDSPSSGALPRLLFILVMGKPQNRSRFSSFRREAAAATLCS